MIVILKNATVLSPEPPGQKDVAIAAGRILVLPEVLAGRGPFSNFSLLVSDVWRSGMNARGVLREQCARGLVM